MAQGHRDSWSSLDLPFDTSYANSLLPILPAFLDAVVDARFDGVDGSFQDLFRRVSEHVLFYLVQYNFGDDQEEEPLASPETRNLPPAERNVLDGLTWGEKAGDEIHTVRVVVAAG